ncbi:hypothetical protein H0H81_011777 [Sphagnurus paluster]|uniref:Zn(2)-C6 fungal-type domain-containing protein n=1 Tax=Sphagnurus paluster TaxID=117069 RepID=A0A9P7GJR4_9AGAR|nr:hypothetical protein H0H81_011777 [Sphagnurus paluster]
MDSSISEKHNLTPTSLSSPSRKRRKGATRLSCAECRRLKLRCDRGIPCSSCIKRGCGAICPDGCLTTGQGNRFVLASTEELHEKITELATRVRQLEDALRVCHSQLSTERHPLLSDELLRIKAPLQREPTVRIPAPSNDTAEGEEQNPDVVDAFGTLSIGVSGESKYFGHIANSWYFLQNELPEDIQQAGSLASLRHVLPPQILNRASAIPISTTNIPSESDRVGLRDIFAYLPSSDKALELRSIYFSHAAWMYDPISQESFESQVYTQFYDPNFVLQANDPLLSHRLSVMFMVLAIGSLMDTSLPAYNLEAEKYHQLARAALFTNSIFDEPTINAVQALFLMTFYLFLADRHGTSSGARWTIMGIAIKVGQSIGLHRDSRRWNVDALETQHRRELFWELFTYDSWQCLTFGRPPSFALPHVDCSMPFLNDTSDEKSFHAWKHRFTSECMNLLHDQAFGAKMPTYATVLQLDRKMRAFPVPPILQVAGFGSSESRPGGFPQTVMLTLQRHIVLAIREMSSSFFARAISDHPKDPLGSPYGASVIGAYRSASSLVALMRNLHTQLEKQSERIWFLWTHMFSCAIILGSIVTRCPSMSLAPSALVQLDSACELFSKAALGFSAGKDIMLKLQEKAHFSLDEFKKGYQSSLTKYSLSPTNEAQSPVDQDDELSLLGGKTRLVAPASPKIVDRSPTSLNPVIPLPLSPSMRAQAHPIVWEYLDSFNQHNNQEISPLRSATRKNSQDPAGSSAEHYSPYSQATPQASIYGSSTTLNTNPTFQDSAPYLAQSQQLHQAAPQHYYAQHHTQQQPIPNNARTSLQTFPTYFPVFDYGAAMNSTAVGGTTNGGMNNAGELYGDTHMLESESNPMGYNQRRGSGSPEGNMHSTWRDFVAGFSS